MGKKLNRNNTFLIKSFQTHELFAIKNTFFCVNRYTFHSTIIVSKYYHQLADKNFLKYSNFKRTILVAEGTYYKKIGYVYKKKDSSHTPKAIVKSLPFWAKKIWYDLGFSVDDFKLTFPKCQGSIQELLTPSSELINKTEPKTKGFA